MKDLEFFVYKVPSAYGQWLAAFEGKELIYLGAYGVKKGRQDLVEADLADFFHKNYHFDLGKFTPAKWTKGNFWNTRHKIKVQGTEFQMKVWLKLTEIPEGETWTYSELAKKMRQPSATRAVASAVAKNPICYWIPCHRVVGKGPQKLKYHWGPEMKLALLEGEGAFTKA